jgi:hypothetical protein
VFHSETLLLAIYRHRHKDARVTKLEFEQLRDLPDKVIKADIEFVAANETSPNLIFEQVEVSNSQNWEILLNGTFKPDIPSVTFNFVLRGVGPICRFCVNGQIHGAAGRTHKHSLDDASDPRLNLPKAAARPDLNGKTPREIWQILCQQANIKHTGNFKDPG